MDATPMRRRCRWRRWRSCAPPLPTSCRRPYAAGDSPSADRRPWLSQFSRRLPLPWPPRSSGAPMRSRRLSPRPRSRRCALRAPARRQRQRARARAVVVVDVAGKVRHPGVVRLPSGSRVLDALTAAGGVLRGVDLTGLNLARTLQDGEQVVVGVASPAPAHDRARRCHFSVLRSDRPEQRDPRAAGDAAGHRPEPGSTDHRLAYGSRPLHQRRGAARGLGHRRCEVRRPRTSGPRVTGMHPAERPDLRLLPAAAAVWLGALGLRVADVGARARLRRLACRRVLGVLLISGVESDSRVAGIALVCLGAARPGRGSPRSPSSSPVPCPLWHSDRAIGELRAGGHRRPSTSIDADHRIGSGARRRRLHGPARGDRRSRPGLAGSGAGPASLRRRRVGPASSPASTSELTGRLDTPRQGDRDVAAVVTARGPPEQCRPAVVPRAGRRTAARRASRCGEQAACRRARSAARTRRRRHLGTARRPCRGLPNDGPHAPGSRARGPTSRSSRRPPCWLLAGQGCARGPYPRLALLAMLALPRPRATRAERPARDADRHDRGGRTRPGRPTDGARLALRSRRRADPHRPGPRSVVRLRALGPGHRRPARPRARAGARPWRGGCRRCSPTRSPYPRPRSSSARR